MVTLPQKAACHVLVGLAVAGFALGACGQDGEPPTVRPSIEDAGDDYFGGADFIGKTVTVTGDVVRVISPTSFVVAASRYGDESLLVLSEAPLRLERDAQVTLDGNVQKFGYESYADEYDLDAGPAAYAEFNGEDFLVAMQPPAPASGPPS